MSYTDLITYAELQTDALSSVDGLDGLQSEAERAIADVTQRIESYLNRKLIVRKHSQLVQVSDWIKSPFTSKDTYTAEYVLWANEWPVVETITSELSLLGDGRRVQVDRDGVDAGTYEYFAGYKRSDQTLSGLQGESGLSSLTVEPDELPEDIRRVAVSLTLYELVRHQDGSLGQRRVQTSGTVSITVDGADPNLPRRELEKLDTHRKVL